MIALRERHYALAGTLARGFRWRGADPEDVRQEALLALHEAARVYDPTGARDPYAPFYGFARMCIRRHLIDCVRVARRRPQLCEFVDEHVASVVDLEEYVAQRDRLRRVLDVPLKPRERAVLARAVQGCSYSEIAEELDLSPSVVKWTAWRARSRLREAA